MGCKETITNVFTGAEQTLGTWRTNLNLEYEPLALLSPFQSRFATVFRPVSSIFHHFSSTFDHFLINAGRLLTSFHHFIIISSSFLTLWRYVAPRHSLGALFQSERHRDAPDSDEDGAAESDPSPARSRHGGLSRWASSLKPLLQRLLGAAALRLGGAPSGHHGALPDGHHLLGARCQQGSVAGAQWGSGEHPVDPRAAASKRFVKSYITRKAI